MEGMVVPRVERSGSAGLVISIANTNGISEIEENLFRGSAQAALMTGVPVSVQYGADAVDDLDILLGEGIAPHRVIIGGLDRLEAVEHEEAFKIAQRGAYVAIDHIGWTTHDGYINDEDRAQLIVKLFAAGFGDRILLSTHAVGVAKGYKAKELGFDYLLSTFVPILRKAGLTDRQIRLLVAENPQRVLTIDASIRVENKSVVKAEQQ